MQTLLFRGKFGIGVCETKKSSVCVLNVSVYVCMYDAAQEAMTSDLQYYDF